MADKKCPSCGSGVAANHDFCSACGADLIPKKSDKKSGGRDIFWFGGFLIVIIAVYFLFFFKSAKLPHHGDQTQMPTGENPMMSAAMKGELPGSYDSLVILGNNFMDGHHYSMAIECYTRAAAIDSTKPSLFTDLGVCYHYSGNSEKGIELMERALALDNRHKITLFNLGIVYRELKDYDKVRTYWSRLIELYPDEPIADSIKKYMSALEG
jgi:tetratricopeptide (TPR) repeat protein